MIKTKITQNTTNSMTHVGSEDQIVPSANQTSASALPTTGRPVLMTPKGPISMRNMRKKPTQEELVSIEGLNHDYVSCDRAR